ncbi:glycosyltransferase family 2 protein [candidate division WOR-3 bacterium]|nr:glycosyltransferase family 2 protein [candidate division WOR-3 bacterium]
MKFSIIIPNWNGKKFLETCLDSLRSQTFRDFEIIVIDNGSRDESAEFIKNNYPKTKIIRLDKNYGFSRAVNEGIKSANGEFVFLLNNDTEVDSNCLFECEQAIQSHSDISIFALRIMNYENRDIIDSAGICYPRSGRPYNIGINSPFSEEYNQERKVFGFCAGGAIIKKSIFKKIGYFDEDFFAYFEDVDFSFRAQLLDYECLYIPDAIVYHRGSALPRKSIPHIYYLHRNVIWTIIKNWPGSLIIKYSPIILLYDFLATLNAIISERTFTTLRAKIDAFKYISKMLEKRKRIQKNRKVSIKDIEKWLEVPEKPLKTFKRKRGV